MIKYIPLIVLLGIAFLIGYGISHNQSDGPIPNELSANRLVVYMVEDTLSAAIKADTANVFDYSSSNIFSSTFTLKPHKGQEEAFRKLVNADDIASYTSQMTSDIEWDDENCELNLQVSKGNVIVPVWLLDILTRKQIFKP